MPGGMGRCCSAQPDENAVRLSRKPRFIAGKPCKAGRLRKHAIRADLK